MPNKDLEGNILKCSSLLNPEFEVEENSTIEPEKSKMNPARRNSEEIRFENRILEESNISGKGFLIILVSVLGS